MGNYFNNDKFNLFFLLYNIKVMSTSNTIDNTTDNSSDLDSFEYSKDSEYNITEEELSSMNKIPDISLYLSQTKDKLVGVFLTSDKKKVVGYINKDKKISSNEIQLSKFNGKEKNTTIIIDDAYDFKTKTCDEVINTKDVEDKVKQYNEQMNIWFENTKKDIQKIQDTINKNKKKEKDCTALIEELQKLKANYNDELSKHNEVIQKLTLAKEQAEKEKNDELSKHNDVIQNLTLTKEQAEKEKNDEKNKVKLLNDQLADLTKKIEAELDASKEHNDDELALLKKQYSDKEKELQKQLDLEKNKEQELKKQLENEKMKEKSITDELDRLKKQKEKPEQPKHEEKPEPKPEQPKQEEKPKLPKPEQLKQEEKPELPKPEPKPKQEVEEKGEPTFGGLNKDLMEVVRNKDKDLQKQIENKLVDVDDNLSFKDKLSYLIETHNIL